jgi:hypothetical protein
VVILSPVGCWEELLDPPDLASMMAAACSMFSRKEFGPLGFSHRREYIGERAMLGGGPRGHTPGGAARGPHHQQVWPASGPPPALLWTPSSCQVIKDFNLCFVQFREYFMCNFSETQKQQKNKELALWHLVNRLVPENA